MSVSFSLNGDSVVVEAEPRELFADVLRDRLGMTGTHVACEQGACGTCTVLVDGQAVRSCLLFAPQLEGCTVTSIEGVGSPGSLHPIQAALSEHHGLQCGFCTPGVVLTAIELLETEPDPDRETIERWMSGNLCRCTGYTGIVDAIAAVAAQRSAQ
jgi:carbon-monoxide dehydrogenase small subunit